MLRLTRPTPVSPLRKGNVLVLASCTISMLIAFTAFVVDIGYITKTRNELSMTADAAALAATLELPDGISGTLTPAQAAANAKTAAVAVAAANVGGGLNSVYANSSRDVKVGNYSWNAATSSWVTIWNVSPYNVVEVTLHRDQAGSTLGDQPLDLFFAPVLGKNKTNIHRVGRSAMLPVTGLKKIPGVNLNILPITLDLPTWNNLLAGNGNDNYSYNDSTGAITSGSDGVKEVDLYPLSSSTTTAGNRGTVDIGSSNNSTADIKRQILYGINDDDMSYFGGAFDWSSGSITLNADTGLSAGIKSELEAIKGKPRMIPIFTSVSGTGNNANYIIVKFVGIRILNVQLTGNQKAVVVQPASYVEPAGVAGTTTVGTGTIFTSSSIVH